jgi:hypothetical protein
MRAARRIKSDPRAYRFAAYGLGQQRRRAPTTLAIITDGNNLFGGNINRVSRE